MKKRVMRVSPAHDGWIIESPTGGAPMTFRTGAEAEARAVEIAKRVARRGSPADIQILDRDGALIATLSYAAERAPTRPFHAQAQRTRASRPLSETPRP